MDPGFKPLLLRSNTVLPLVSSWFSKNKIKHFPILFFLSEIEIILKLLGTHFGVGMTENHQSLRSQCLQKGSGGGCTQSHQHAGKGESSESRQSRPDGSASQTHCPAPGPTRSTRPLHQRALVTSASGCKTSNAVLFLQLPKKPGRASPLERQAQRACCPRPRRAEVLGERGSG